MGGDLISYAVIGPYQITEEKLDAAKRAYLAWIRDNADDFICTKCDGAQPAADEHDDPDECDYCYAHGCLIPIRELARWVDGKPACVKTVDEIVTGWAELISGGYRDSAWRSLAPTSPDLVIAYAGEISWGEEPTGQGYVLLKKITRLPEDVSSALGFR